MDDFYPFFIVLFIGVVFSSLFRRLHLPFIVSLIVAGIIIGPEGFDMFEPDPTMEFISQLGLVFLMFLAGLETKLSAFKKLKKDIIILASANALLPLITGLAIGYFFGWSWTPVILLGAIFLSSAVAVVVPSLEHHRMEKTRLGKTIIAATVIEEIAALIVFAVVLDIEDPAGGLPLWLLWVLIILVVAGLRWFLPQAQRLFSRGRAGKDMFRRDLRTAVALLLGTVAAFEILGLDPVIAAFFAGLVLADAIKTPRLKENIHAIGYGVFIPVFFIVVGTELEFSAFLSGWRVVVLAMVMTSGFLAAKFGSGAIGAKWCGFSGRESLVAGSATMAQLSTGLAIAFTAQQLGLVDSSFLTGTVILVIVSVFLAPVLLKIFTKKLYQAKRAQAKALPRKNRSS